MDTIDHFEIDKGPSPADLDGAQAWALRCVEAFEAARVDAGADSWMGETPEM